MKASRLGEWLVREGGWSYSLTRADASKPKLSWWWERVRDLFSNGRPQFRLERVFETTFQTCLAWFSFFSFFFSLAHTTKLPFFSPLKQIFLEKYNYPHFLKCPSLVYKLVNFFQNRYKKQDSALLINHGKSRNVDTGLKCQAPQPFWF